MQDFGQNLKRLPTSKGFSQEAFAAAIGIHATNLSKYERGISVPLLEIDEPMAVALKITMDELVYGSGEQRARNQIADQDLLRLFSQSQALDKHHRQTISEVLDAFILKANLAKQLAQAASVSDLKLSIKEVSEAAMRVKPSGGAVSILQ